MSDSNVSSVSPALAPGINTEHTNVDTATTSAPAAPQTTTSTTNGTDLTTQIQNAGNAALNTATATLSSIGNSQTVQDIKNGPVAQNVSAEATKTTSEFKDLYGSKQIPEQPAATGQPLTQYHSMFWRLLSWQNPRATSITFVGSLLFILAARYLNVLHYVFKFSYFILGITASLEIAGKVLFDNGLATKMRPRQYWTIPRDSLERSLDDVEQLINFFVIETQRIVYAENIYATVAVFASALVSYLLIKLVPFWGLSFIFTCAIYLGPLIYINNKEAIDNGLQHAGDVVSSQAVQIKNLTAENTNKATESLKSVTAQYTSKAQEYVGAKKAELSNNTSTVSGTGSTVGGTRSTVSGTDFPAPPQQEPIVKIEPVVKIEPGSADAEPLLAH